MKLQLEVINYESEQTNYIVKVKLGTQVMQTGLGNIWNQKFLLENKRAADLKVEVWQKLNDFQFIGDGIVPRTESVHRIEICAKGNKEGVLNVVYREVPDPVVQQVLQHDAENVSYLDHFQISKLEKPQKFIQKLNETLNQGSVHSEFSSIFEYFSQTWNGSELTQASKLAANQLVKESFDRVTQRVKVNDITYHLEEADQNLTKNEQNNIKKLQKQLIKNDLQKYEKSRREVNVQILDLDELNSRLRIDQVEQKAKVAQLRKDLIQKLLYIEEKIEHLKRTLIQQNHHVFATNSNLPNSMIEMSQISIQRDFVAKWEQDPKLDEVRQEFVKKQMKEWNELQEKRLQKIQLEEAKIKKRQEKIHLQEKNIREAKTQERKAEAQQQLTKLQEKQTLRKKELEEANKRYDEKKKEQYLALKYAQQDALYMQHVQEERKKKLLELKNPDFDLQDLLKFEQKFEQIHKEKAVNRRKQWEDREAQWNKFRAQYYSESYKRAKDQSKQRVNPAEELKKQAQDKMDHLKKYEYEVRQNFKPTVSERKRVELEENIRKIKFEPDFKRYRELSEKVKEKHIYDGIEKKETVKKIKLKPLESIPTPISPRKIGEFYLKQNGKFNKKNIPPLPKPPNPPQSSHSEKKIPVTDFLKERRQKNQEKQKPVSQEEQILQDDYKMVDMIKKNLEKLLK